MFKLFKKGLLARAASPGEDGGNVVVRIMHSEWAWRKARKAHLLLQPVCMCCGRSKKLQVHHIEPWAQFPAGRYDPYNLVTMCGDCHFRFGHFNNWRDKNPKVLELIMDIQESARSQGVDKWESVKLQPYHYPTVDRKPPVVPADS